jgi:tripartite-type tricarboxylate transporter receptor subunit TctC
MMAAILGNEIPLMFLNQDVLLPHVKAGRLRPLAVTSRERNPLFPDVPTIAESGYPGFEALSWSGISLPRGTPAPIVAKLEAAMAQVMGSAAVRQRMESNGFVIPPQGSRHYTEFVRNEKARWTKVIRTAGIKPE